MRHRRRTTGSFAGLAVVHCVLGTWASASRDLRDVAFLLCTAVPMQVAGRAVRKPCAFCLFCEAGQVQKLEGPASSAGQRVDCYVTAVVSTLCLLSLD